MARKLIEVEEKKEEKKQKKKIDLDKIKKTLKDNEDTIEMLAGSLGEVLDTSRKKKKSTKSKSKKKTTKSESSLGKLLSIFLNR